MGQTLTHGVYLPDEGERNCYSGLAANWQFLDGAVGTIAEHTTQIAGKAPLVHTHGKADVTDLLNSNFIPSANNSYDLGSSANQWNNLYATTTNTDTIQSASGNLVIHSTGTDKAVFIHNGANAGDGGGLFLYGKTHSNGSLIRLQIYNTTTSSYEAIDLASSSFYPYTNNLINLGTSTKKWKTINGINPGALSLPNINYTEGSPDVYNIGTDINNLTKNTTDPLHFSWTSPFDGWLSIMWYLRNIDPPYNILITSDREERFSKFSQTWSASSSRWYLATTFPVVKNVTYYFNIDFQNTTIGVVHHAYLLPCLGNV